MSDTLILNKMSLVVTTRCNLRCKLCDEFIPQHKPFPDMTIAEERKILHALFGVADHVKLLHLSGGGEPFLNPNLAEMVAIAFEYSDKFDQLMVFTNSTIKLKYELLDVMIRYKEKIMVHCSNYGLFPERAEELYAKLTECAIPHRITKYYGDNQDYGGWIDFGEWVGYSRTKDELAQIYKNCGITRIMHGNWRTRDGTVHWCQRSQRGHELDILPNYADDYIDLFDNSTTEQKREKFYNIMSRQYLCACGHCSGNHGTYDNSKRFPAGEQMER
jgi:hypothetical protein